MRPRISPSLALAGNYVALFAIVGIWLPYWPLWLSGQGYDDKTVGWLVGLASWARLVANPLTAQYVARHGASRRLLQTLALAGCLAYVALLAPVGLWGVVVLSLMVSLALSPITGLVDGLALALGNAGELDYGRVRLWGSASFVAAALAMGWALDHWVSHTIVVPALAVCTFLVFVTGSTIDRRAFHLVQSPDPLGGGLRQLLSNRSLRRVIAVVTLLNLSHCLFYGFGTLLWQRAGLDKAQIGSLWAESVIAEIVFFALASRMLKGSLPGLRRRSLSPANMLVLAGVAGVIRWSGMSTASSLLAFAALQLLHALTFGAQHMGQLELMARILPRRQLPAALMLSSAIVNGLAMAIGTPIAGYVSSAVGERGYLVMGLLSIAAILTAIIFTPGWNRAMLDYAAEASGES